MPPLGGAALALAISLTAWLARALTLSGAIAAALVGGAILIGGGWAGGAALLTFFISGTLLSHLGADPAAQTGEAKGSRRDPGQVLANGGAAALAAVAGYWEPAASRWAITAALAAAAADTWATTIGGTSPSAPRLLFSGRAVPAGTSGAITWRGTFGAAAGAVIVALVAGAVAGDRPLILLAALIGFLGMFIDSTLGATVQGRFHCPACDLPTERIVHRCGTRTTGVGGWRWVDNDMVNGASTVIAALLGALAWLAVGVRP